MGKNLVLASCEGTWSKMSHEPKSLWVMDDWSIVIVCVPASAMLAPVLKLKYPLKCALLSHPDSVNGSFSLISVSRVFLCSLGASFSLARAREVPLWLKDSSISASGLEQEPSGL